MRFNLIMGMFWLCGAVTLAVYALQGKPFAGLDPDRAQLIIVFGFMLALYNFARWWAARSKKPAAPPPRKKVLFGEQQEYLPEFDFQKPAPKPGESTNESQSGSA
jgi:branched-subunit amino acid ABC-type transport system permease component